MSDTAFLLCLALLLDALLGEPAWLWSRLPHPAVMMGRLVGVLDRRLNHAQQRRTRGVLALVVLVVTGLIVGSLLQMLGNVVAVIVAAILLAQRSLAQHVLAVAEGLDRGGAAGRRAVANIVSRDTAAMNAPQVARSAIESGAENFSDGVVAPAFWFLLGGLPGLLIYKLVNTADSMIGYRTDQYREFGWAAARCDDLLNLIPARLSAVLLALPARITGHLPGAPGEILRAIRTDAGLHRSPNAGWPEAAMARALSVALAGPRSYEGQLREFPWVNSTASRSPSAETIRRCVVFLWYGWAMLLVVAVALALIF